MDLSEVLKELISEKKLDRDAVIDVACDAIKVAYEKRFLEQDFEIVFDNKTLQVNVFVKKLVVEKKSDVTDPENEIFLENAKAYDPNAMVDELVRVPFEKKISRSDVATAKGVLAAGLKKIEEKMIYDSFIDKKGSVITGSVHKKEVAGISVNLGDTIAFLPNSGMIPGETFHSLNPVVAMIKSVNPVADRHGYQIVLDRSDAEFVKKLFVSEVPELFDGSVVIKAIERIAGYKTKIALFSTKKNIDPIGACVGVAGVRIKVILKELGGVEKVDLIPWTEELTKYIADSLKPAVIKEVLLELDGSATVFVEADQCSAAIGRMGQNISMATALTGVKINLNKVG